MLIEQTARRHLQDLLTKYERMTEAERRQLTEDGVIRQFIDILLRDVLGWPIEDPARYKYEMHTQAGRPDVTLLPESGGVIFLEAKRFGVIKQLEQARYTTASTITPGQLALPGMAADRTTEEQQAINYAFGNGGTWAILTNFEKLRLFNARRDWLVLSFEEPSAYVRDFDLLWQLAYPNVLNGSLDALSSQRHTADVDKDYLAFINEWRQKLAEDIVQRLDTNPWARRPDGEIDLPLLRAVVQRFLDRLVIVRFAEDHLVIPPGTLRELYEVRRNNRYTFTMDEFLDRFFRQFDQQHNSALFAPGPVDEASFSDAALLPLVGKLYEARYRAMPADILGNTYEQYLGKTLTLDNGRVITRDNLETRKKQGSYYTPQVIVRYIVDNSLGRYLYGTHNGQPDGQPVPGETRKTAADIRDLRVLDSACGSGSFLIYAYEVLKNFYESELARLEREAEARRAELAAQGVTDIIELGIQLTPFTAERDRIRNYPRLILEHHLYGVDLDPQAAEIAVVNLIMRAMEGRHRDKHLPLILNQNVKVGNTLVGLRPDDPRLDNHRPALARIRELRAALVAAPQGEAHNAALRALEAATADLNAALEAHFAPHFSDLERVRPFHWGVEFPEAFYDAAGAPLPDPGFTVIFGNPPWEILKPNLREFYAQYDERIESKLNRKQVEQRIAELDAEDPRRRRRYEQQTRAIEETAAWVRQSGDYTRQGRGDTATHKLFIERMYRLLRDGGRLGYVVPSGIYTDLGTKDLREMLLGEGRIESLISLTNGLAGGAAYFPDIHRSFKITLLCVRKGKTAPAFQAAFYIDPRQVPHPDTLLDRVASGKDFFEMEIETIRRFSPDSLSVMEFQTRRDYEIAEKIYDDHPLLGQDVPDSWNVKFTREFDMTNDRDMFNTRGVGLPLYEGKMIHQFNAYFAEPQYWVEEHKGRERLANKTGLDYQRCRLAFRDIARSTDERTFISAVLPPRVFCNNKTPLVRILDTDDERVLLYMAAIFNSFGADFLMRQKVASTLNFFYVETFPMPRLSAGHPAFDALVARAARLTCTRAEYAALWQQVTGAPWDATSGATDPAERQRLRDEIDALVARLYGLTRSEFDHILGTFPLVFPPTDAGRARREALLAAYDAAG